MLYASHWISLGFGAMALDAQPLEQIKQSNCKGSCINRGGQKCKYIIQVQENETWPNLFAELGRQEAVARPGAPGRGSAKGDDRAHELGKYHG